MKLTFLGTSAGTPSRTRNVTSLAVTHNDGSTWIFDCGEGTQHQILKTFIKPGRINRLFITHFHGDHWYGIFGLLASLKIHGRRDPLTIISPPGLKKAVEAVHIASGSQFSFDINFIEVEHYSKFTTEHNTYVEAVPILHSKLCFGYIITTPDRPGRFDITKAKENELDQVKHIQALTSGVDVVKDGKLFKAQDFRELPVSGQKIVILGDTYDASEICKYVSEPDWLVHECTYDSSKKEKALEFGHSTAVMAGQMAKKLNARNLVLTHFSPRYHESSEISVEKMVEEAQISCENTQVVAAFDFFTLKLN